MEGMSPGLLARDRIVQSRRACPGFASGSFSPGHGADATPTGPCGACIPGTIEMAGQNSRSMFAVVR
jgi:hypothetical protein